MSHIDPVLAILQSAKDWLLDKDHWTTGSTGRPRTRPHEWASPVDADQTCVLGAVGRADGQLFGYCFSEDGWEAVRLLSEEAAKMNDQAQAYLDLAADVPDLLESVRQMRIQATYHVNDLLGFEKVHEMLDGAIKRRSEDG